METGIKLSLEKKDQISISVIVPAYNVGAYLSACLTSILNQTLQGIEIIIVDDGSSDNTGVIADNYKEKYPERVVVLHTENRGVTNARLAGVEMARGEWIGFVDGDDEIESDMYERLLNNAIKYNAEISHCGSQTIVNGGERIHYYYNTGKMVLQDHIHGMQDLLEGTFIEPSLCNKLFKIELLLDLIQSDIMDRAIRFNEDLLMNYYLFSQAYTSIYEDFCGYHYMARIDSATRTNQNSARVLDPIVVNKYIKEREDGVLHNRAEINYIMACLHAWEQICNMDGEQKMSKVVRQELLRYKGTWKYLRTVDRIKIYALLMSPNIYIILKQCMGILKKEKVYE